MSTCVSTSLVEYLRWGRGATPGTRPGPHCRYLYIGATEQGKTYSFIARVRAGPWTRLLVCTPLSSQYQWKGLDEVTVNFTSMETVNADIILHQPDLVIFDDIQIKDAEQRDDVCDLLKQGSHHNDHDVALLSHYWKLGYPESRAEFTHLVVFPLGFETKSLITDMGLLMGGDEPKLYKPITFSMFPAPY